MDPALDSNLPEDSDWPRNYFNYFTEIEEHFQRARGTGLFLLSPLDWALLENWKASGIPLEAVFKGINDAFEKWHGRKSKRSLVNSLTYCAQAVLKAAQRLPSRAGLESKTADAPFRIEELRAHLDKATTAFRERPEPGVRELASSLETLSSEAERYVHDLERLERRLVAMEDKIIAVLRASETADELLAAREGLDRELRPYRGRMTADQLAMLERRYLDSALLERAKLPRLSLFYLH
jgi:hypothetical protein